MTIASGPANGGPFAYPEQFRIQQKLSAHR
jgi:hypothetical protein